ncbi:unnamed protein product [Durusdinium trenchii]|uniref:Uncharacterized protein n=1 Tax=Durusdinium trenchii TaxID=1381693 RepID=A0ABP0IAY9_9DINO
MGYGIIDGGATRTLASVHALEAMVNENLRRHQDGRVLRATSNIRALREEPPAKWGVTELRVRLEELEEEHGIVRQTGRSRTDLQEWTVKLNKAGPKKSVLVEFCQKELLIPLSGNETIPQLNKKAMDRIYHLPDCRAEWAGPDRALNIFYHEEDKGDRLSRFARWYEQAKEQTPTPKTLPPPGPLETKTKGYTKAKAAPKKVIPTGSASSGTQDPAQETQALTKIMSALTDLKDEVEALKEERPHKKKDTSSDNFSMVSGQTP